MNDETTGAMDIQAIRQVLPHRPPFLLVDRVTQCTPGATIAGYKNVSRNEPFFAHPCPPAAAMPDMLVIEAMAQIAVILTIRTLDVDPESKALFFFAGIDDNRFFGEVHAGDRLDLGSNLVRLMESRGIGKFKTFASVDGRPVAEATMIAAMRKGER